MKTKILFIAMLLLGGLVISSCQKDNSLVPDDEPLAVTKDVNGTPDDIVPHWEKDPITNYPDPFTDKTTIEFTLQRSARITLVVAGPDFGGITYLMSGYYRAGTYKCIFDATDLPAGEYIASLKIDNIVVKERMTKREIQKKNDHLAN